MRGSAYATLAARIFMAVWLLIVIVRGARRHRAQPRLRDTPLATGSRRACASCSGSGFPAGGQMVLEVGVFAAATALAGRVSAERAGGAPDRA